MLLRFWFFLLCFVGCLVAAHRAEPCRHLAVPDPLLPLPTTTECEKGNFLANHHCSPDCTLHTAQDCTLQPLQPPQERLFSHQTPVSAHGLMIPTLFAPSSRTWILTYQANLGPRRPVRPVTALTRPTAPGTCRPCVISPINHDFQGRGPPSHHVPVRSVRYYNYITLLSDRPNIIPITPKTAC
jgi:hypothetical protein